MLKIALILAVLPAVIMAGRVRFGECRQGGHLPNWVEIPGCDESSCVIVNGAEVDFIAEITPIMRAESLTTSLSARWLIFDTTLDLPDHVVNGCNSFGQCPVTEGNTYVVRNSFVVSSLFSDINPTIEFLMVTETGARFVCVSLDVNLIPMGL